MVHAAAVELELKTLFGLPAHPLLVHAAVVLLPIAAVATILLALLPRAREQYAVVVLAVALGATIAVLLAQGSGEELEDRVEETELVEEHTEKGEQVLPWAIALTAVSAGVAAAGRLQRRYPGVSPARITAALTVLALLASVGATWTIVDVGHSGAKATWNDPEANGDD